MFSPGNCAWFILCLEVPMDNRDCNHIYTLTRGHGGLTHHLHSEAPSGNHRMAMTFAKLRLIVFLRCI